MIASFHCWKNYPVTQTLTISCESTGRMRGGRFSGIRLGDHLSQQVSKCSSPQVLPSARPWMVYLSATVGAVAVGRGRWSRYEVQAITFQELVVKPRPSFTNSRLFPQGCAIFVPNERLASRFSASQSHCILKVLVKVSLVVIR